MGRTLAEKLWDSHVVRRAAGEPDLLYIDMHLVHEVTSPQAFDGLRLAGRPVRRPDLTLATEDHNVPDAEHRSPDRRPGQPHPGRDAAQELRRLRYQAVPDGRHRTGHRARHRPAAGHHPAGNDDGLRRLAHVHPRRVRRAGVRYRHQPGRARAGDADPADGPAQDDGGDGRRRPAAGRHAQGRDPRRHRPDRHRRRPGLHGRVPRQRLRADVDGRPHDGLQHEHRMGRAGRHDRARRGHLRLPEGASARADGRDWDAAVEYWTVAAHRRRRRVRRRGRPGRRGARAVRHLGHQPRARARRCRRRCPTRPTSPTTADRVAAERPWIHGSRGRARRCATSRSTPSSSAPAPTAASRTCARRPRSSTAAWSPPACGCSSCPARCGCGPRPSRKAWTQIFTRRRGGVAPGRLLDVPGHEPRPARARASAARPRRTATSRAGRARAAARIWCRRSSPRPPP